jgi:colanic acid/amylovoran biosynthesis glycosyltransferase
VDTQPELLRAEMARAEAVVTVSEHNREYLSRWLGSTANGKVRCIPDERDLRQFPFDRSRPADAPPVILSIGRLIENKGLRARLYQRVVSPVSDVAPPDTKGTPG